MGQLEKYGLYVMCLVIFLILGVSLWDVGEPPSPAKQTPSITTQVATNGNAGSSAGIGGVDSSELDALFRPTERPRDGRQPAKPPAADGGRAAETVASEAAVDKGGNRSGGDKSGGDKAGTPPVDAGKPPAEGRRAKYRIQQDDTLESIARSKLGSAALHAEIQRLNPEVRPTRLRVGQEIVLPSSADLALRSPTKAAAPIASGERLYTVRKGDNLEGIAGSQLGDKRRVDELRRLNPNVEETKLRIGQSLKLPKK